VPLDESNKRPVKNRFRINASIDGVIKGGLQPCPRPLLIIGRP
jgi:hypothetical protein